MGLLLQANGATVGKTRGGLDTQARFIPLPDQHRSRFGMQGVQDVVEGVRHGSRQVVLVGGMPEHAMDDAQLVLALLRFFLHPLEVADVPDHQEMPNSSPSSSLTRAVLTRTVFSPSRLDLQFSLPMILPDGGLQHLQKEERPTDRLDAGWQELASQSFRVQPDDLPRARLAKRNLPSRSVKPAPSFRLLVNCSRKVVPCFSQLSPASPVSDKTGLSARSIPSTSPPSLVMGKAEMRILRSRPPERRMTAGAFKIFRPAATGLRSSAAGCRLRRSSSAHRRVIQTKDGFGSPVDIDDAPFQVTANQAFLQVLEDHAV